MLTDAIFFTIFSTMTIKSTFPIKYVALQTGLKPYLIRSWESRYNAICPQRSDTNRRVFRDADIRRLKLLKHAVSIGHSISHAARLTDEALMALTRHRNGSIQQNESAFPSVSGEDVRESSDVLNMALFHILRLDAASLEAVLDRAALEMPRQAFLDDIVTALFARIGELWRAGKLKAVNEHMTSVIIRSMLWDMMRSEATPREAMTIVVTTPAGHWHETGALAAALAAAESGWRVSYFGANLPSDEIAHAAAKTGAQAIALGICHRLNDSRLTVELKNLRRLVGERLPIFLGGAGVADTLNDNVNSTINVCADLVQFRQQLDEAAIKIRGG
jgi:DNA-binding transcriptional MerR regulator/methylmalonyl-CoA mutase cobalamin-binding subunit